MAAAHLKKDITLLKMLSKLKPNDFKEMMSSVADSTIDNICECVYNLIYNPSLKMNARKKSKLRSLIRSKCSVRRLKNISNKSQPIFKRRQALKQEGKGLPFLLASAIPFLINLFTGK